MYDLPFSVGERYRYGFFTGIFFGVIVGLFCGFEAHIQRPFLGFFIGLISGAIVGIVSVFIANLFVPEGEFAYDTIMSVIVAFFILLTIFIVTSALFDVITGLLFCAFSSAFMVGAIFSVVLREGGL